ncbi:MAG TPA: hypothetical protein VK324_16100 [Tepidisphaeraceae bacterium]|nr:hypothetical protein [Tepidisphaeraceae bacterium]
MSEQPHQPNQNLSDIGHLFLSSVRERHMNGAPKPVRLPPGAPRPSNHPHQDVSIDLTPEEFAQVFGDVGATDGSDDDTEVVDAVRCPPVTAVLGAHLNRTQFDRVKAYARALAARVGRVGLIELDASEFRLMCFEPTNPADEGAEPPADAEPTEGYDARAMAEAIEELNCDVEHWLLLLPSPRTPEAKALLREIDRWALLSTCDHDGVVSCYRTLKGLADLHRPALSLALLDVTDDRDAAKVFAKLSSVCRQFLSWPLEAEPNVLPAADVAEALVMCCRPTRDKGQHAAAPQWQIVTEFLATARTRTAAKQRVAPARPAESTLQHHHDLDEVALNDHHDAPAATPETGPKLHVADAVIPGPLAAPRAESTHSSRPHAANQSVAEAPLTDVVDLTGSDASPGAILSAIVRHEAGGMIEVPVRPPMCSDARLAVDRTRGLVLLAVARAGLGDLRAIGQAYRWLSENRALIGMAVPQLSIDAHQYPRLRLMVEQSDLSAEVLQPLMQSGTVTIQAYRKLRWGDRTGLLLEAA